jgi:hypothetical protein
MFKLYCFFKKAFQKGTASISKGILIGHFKKAFKRDISIEHFKNAFQKGI